MSVIRILSEHIANQIAAGEVVERPASVLKELVENSLDAGATTISVDIEGGGVRLIRVCDNGSGMDEDDVLLCIERHATSKLHREEDLGAIATLGFRGEALPSIGSVSHMTILSRPRRASLGTRAEVRYGRLTRIHATGCASGTTVEIRRLFGNVPARRKFLKTRRTEIHHLEEAFRHQALANPQVEMRLAIDGRPVFHFSAADTLEERFRQIYRIGEALIELETTAAEGNGVAVRGFLLPPDSGAAAAGRLRFLVNKRPVRNPMMLHAVREGMHSFLMKGRQPHGALLVTLPGDQVDVNVHPAKLEMKFRQPRIVHGAIVQAVRRGMSAHQQRLRREIFTEAFPRLREEERGDGSGKDIASCRVCEPVPRRLPQDAGEAGLKEKREESSTVSIPAAGDGGKPAAPVAESLSFSDLRLMGSCFDLYLFFEGGDRLVVIDQHAAHERILYEQLRSGWLAGAISSQILLFPATVELTAPEIDLVRQHGETIAALGFTVEHFGGETYVVKAVPALLGHLDGAQLLRELLDGLKTGDDRSREGLTRLIDDRLASMACKAAVKSGNRLQPEEMIDLLEQMRRSSSFSHCPHGRPVCKVFSREELKKWFHRT